MGLKPRYHSISLIPRFYRGRLSALADGLCKSLLSWALAASRLVLVKRLIQINYLNPEACLPKG